MRLLALFLPLLAVVQAQEDMLQLFMNVSEAIQNYTIKEIEAIQNHTMKEIEAIQKYTMQEMQGCLKVTAPDELMAKIGTCFKETMMMNFDEFRQNDFLPDLMITKKMLGDFKRCYLNAIGVDADGLPVSAEELVEKKLISQWTGEDQPKMLKYATDCINEANAETAIEQVLMAEKCLLKRIVIYCETMDENPGQIVPSMMLLYTLREPPKCSNVEVPKEYQINLLTCMEEARKNMTTNINFINEITTENNLTSKMKTFGQEFGLEFTFSTFGCMMKSLPGTLNVERMTVSLKSLGSKVKGFDGWDSPDDSKAIYNGIVKCNKYFERSVPSEGETRLEGIKRLMMVKKRFDSCFFPVLAETCGITNEDLAGFFLPIMNKEMTGKMMTDFLKSVVFMGVEHVKYFWEHGLPPPLNMMFS